jgi:16S rRNA (uracil1498-N3)-methyltransferase
MHRFFIDKGNLRENLVALSAEDAAHALRVLRLQRGDEIAVCDNEDWEYSATVAETGKNQVTVRLGAGRPLGAEPQTKITLYQGVPKAGKMEYLVQKGTEIGISCFVPVFFGRCVVKPGNKDKASRYERVAYEAAKQAHRGRIPRVGEAMRYEKMLEELGRHQLVLAAWEEEKARSVREALTAAPHAKDIAVVIGPEGGLEPHETQAMKEAGARVITLGPRILRTETAGAVLAAMILYERGDMQ